jgi:iron(III) transport system substrate-binding protein
MPAAARRRPAAFPRPGPRPGPRARGAVPLALAAALGAACSRPAPTLPEVRLYVSEDLPAAVAIDAAARFGVARAIRAARPEEAEVAWCSDPAAALALGELLQLGTAPSQEGVAARWRDPRGRFAPLGARARVLLVRSGGALPFAPADYRDLADPRVGGRVAFVPPARGANPVALAALALAYGDASVERFLRLLARNGPQLAASDAEVRARVASGAASIGLAGSVDGAAAAASAAPVAVVYPDQAGRGAVVLPTAVARLRGAGDAAERLAAWLAGADAERIVVARAPGLLPLRAGVPVPPGVEPAANLRSLPLDWDRLLAERERLGPILERWPDGFRETATGR